MRTNIKRTAASAVTHEGAPARRIGALAELRRTVSACLLWESTFYEDGVSVADRIKDLVPQCKPHDVAALAIETRESFNLRHAPLLLVRELARTSKEPQLVSKTLARVVQRADELAEFLSIYWRDGKVPISKQVKRGLAWAFRKFSEYDLAKYNRDASLKLRDVLFMTHPMPKDEEQAKLWKRVACNELVTPDTWEVQLSAGKDKKETFERLLREGKLGYLALLRNLRNMIEAKCDPVLVINAIRARKGAHRVLPFRYIAAARYAPQFEAVIDAAMQASMEELPRLPGETFVLVDHSGSMQDQLSGKSDLKRWEAAAALAILAVGTCERCRVFSFANGIVEVPARRGMALRDAIAQTPSGGTYLGAAVSHLNGMPHDRLIVVTDEQSHDTVPGPKAKGYMINVATFKNGVGYGAWTHLDGFSESIMRYINIVEGVPDHGEAQQEEIQD